MQSGPLRHPIGDRCPHAWFINSGLALQVCSHNPGTLAALRRSTMPCTTSPAGRWRPYVLPGTTMSPSAIEQERISFCRFYVLATNHFEPPTGATPLARPSRVYRASRNRRSVVIYLLHQSAFTTRVKIISPKTERIYISPSRSNLQSARTMVLFRLHRPPHGMRTQCRDAFAARNFCNKPPPCKNAK